ncbi:MAG: hypothetical protein ACRCUH_10325 [Shewanella sp.]
MTTYNTQNPVPSVDVRDLYDNAQNLDKLTNGTAATYPDRLGFSRKSYKGMELDFSTFLASSGFELPALVYVDGSPLTVDRPAQLIERGGSLYGVKVSETFPATLTGVFATDQARLVERTDSAIRQELAAPGGAGLVGLDLAGSSTTVAEFAQNRGAIIAKGLGVGVDSTAVLQDAVNYWDLNPNMCIRVIGHLEVQGTVQIPNKEILNPERRLTITGGDLAKYNAGFMFTRLPGQSMPDGSGGTLELQTGHVTFDDVRFLGPRTTAGTYIIDGDNVIRTKFVNCYGDGIQIAYAAKYLQSIYVDTASVFRKWKGWLFDCGHLYDVRFYGAAEAGESFMRTRDVNADPAANSLVVRGLIEGLSGKVFEIGVCFGVVIDGNYQEANAGGDYDFSIGNSFHKGLTLIGNGFQPNAAQLADPNYYPVKLGKGASNSITLIGNSSSGNLFDVLPANQSTIIDVGNWCASGKKLFSRVSREFSFSDSIEGRFRLVDGIGVGLHSYYEKFGFESARAIVGGESVSAGLTIGDVSPQTSPGSYPQKNWVAGTFVFNKSPTISARQYGTVARDALILGWVCQTAGTPGAWREVPVMLPFQ